MTSVGNGSKKQVVAHLSEIDSGAGIPDRVIQFYADGSFIGEATTDAQGIASLPLPAANRGSKTIFTACFAGDDSYSAAGTCGPS